MPVKGQCICHFFFYIEINILAYINIKTWGGSLVNLPDPYKQEKQLNHLFNHGHQS